MGHRTNIYRKTGISRLLYQTIIPGSTKLQNSEYRSCQTTKPENVTYVRSSSSFSSTHTEGNQVKACHLYHMELQPPYICREGETLPSSRHSARAVKLRERGKLGERKGCGEHPKLPKYLQEPGVVVGEWVGY